MKRVTIWIALLACAAVLLLVPIGCVGDDDGGSGGSGGSGGGNAPAETTEETTPAETTEETHPEETTEG